MKYLVLKSETCDYDLDAPVAWAFDSYEEARDYAHNLCSDWIERLDEDLAEEVNKMYVSDHKYEAEVADCYVRFDEDRASVDFNLGGATEIRIVALDENHSGLLLGAKGDRK